MFSFLSNLGLTSGSTESDIPTSNDEIPVSASADVQLPVETSKDQIRQMRLQKLSQSMPQSSPKEPATHSTDSETAPPTSPSSTITDSIPNTAKEVLSSSAIPAVVDHIVPPKRALSASPAASESTAKATATSPIAIARSQSAPSKPATPIADVTRPPGVTIDKVKLALNIALEEIMLMTYRPEAATSVIRLVGEAGSSQQYIGKDNLSDLMCSRLSEGGEFRGSTGFLYGCIKRCFNKEGVCDEKIKPHLTACRGQMVSLLGCTLADPDMFPGTNKPTADLYQIICSETALNANTISSTLSILIEELNSQCCADQVLSELFELFWTDLQAVPPSGVRSILAMPLHAHTALATVCKADKRLAAALTESSAFIVQPARTLPPQLSNVHPQMMSMPAFQEQHAVAGAALELKTVLGSILRYSPDVRDPQVMAMFSEAHRQSKVQVDNNFATIRRNLKLVQQNASDIVLCALKAGGGAKDKVLLWLTLCLSLNREAEKGHPSPLIASSSGFLINLGAVCLSLCKPVVSDLEKLRKVDWTYLSTAESLEIYPEDFTPLVSPASLSVSSDSTTPEPASLQRNSSSKMTFVTQSFFMCWRAIHLGIAQQFHQYFNLLRSLSHFQDGLASGEPRAVHYLVLKLIADVVLLNPDLVTELLQFCSGAAQSLLLALEVGSTPAQTADASRGEYSEWLLPQSSLTATQRQLLLALPEHLLDDILIILFSIAKTEPSHLSKVSLEPVLSLIIFFLRRPWAVQSPHLRATFGEVLFQVFLPCHLRGRGDMWWGHSVVHDGPHSSLLGYHSEAQQYLAPALLLLYGDVERTGFYDKLKYRRGIMIVLKHLWSLPTHRQAFRGIASACSPSSAMSPSSLSLTESPSTEEAPTEIADATGKDYFIRFANGLMNETNALVSTTMEKLAEIKKAQQVMASASEWAALGAEGQNQLRERLQQHEGEVKGVAGLCLETLNMLNYLTSDEVIRQPFLLPQILPRFVSMLLSVLCKIVGPKGLEIKVENAEQYNFNPKVMMKEVCEAMSHFSQYPAFAEALAQDGFYDDGRVVQKTLSTAARHQLLPPDELVLLEKLYEQSLLAKASLQDLDAIVADAPDEFLDPILSTLMRDPVRLPTSGTVIDRATIAQHLLNDETDPFNRRPLLLSTVVPETQLKARIDEWLASKLRPQSSSTI